MHGDNAVAQSLKVVVERHPDGSIAYPLGVRGVVVGQGDTVDEAHADLVSAIAFHEETFGREVLNEDQPVLAAFVTEARVT